MMIDFLLFYFLGDLSLLSDLPGYVNVHKKIIQATEFLTWSRVISLSHNMIGHSCPEPVP